MSMNKRHFRPLITSNRSNRNGIISKRHRDGSRSTCRAQGCLQGGGLTRYLRQYNTRIRYHLMSVLIRLFRPKRCTRRRMKHTRDSIYRCRYNRSLQCTRTSRRRRRQRANSGIYVRRQSNVNRIRCLPYTQTRVRSTSNYGTTRHHANNNNGRNGNRYIPSNVCRQIIRPTHGRKTMRLNKRSHPITRRLYLHRKRCRGGWSKQMRRHRRRPRMTTNWSSYRRVAPPLSFSTPSSSLMGEVIVPVDDDVVDRETTP